MNNSQTAEIIKLLCKDKSISISNLLNTCHIRKSLIYDMEKRDMTPSADIIEQIADYFDVSVDYLLGRTKKQSTEKIDELSDGAKMVLDLFSRVPEEKQSMVNTMIEAALKSQGLL